LLWNKILEKTRVSRIHLIFYYVLMRHKKYKIDQIWVD
jgi:hypothetical protein